MLQAVQKHPVDGDDIILKETEAHQGLVRVEGVIQKKNQITSHFGLYFCSHFVGFFSQAIELGLLKSYDANSRKTESMTGLGIEICFSTAAMLCAFMANQIPQMAFCNGCAAAGGICRSVLATPVDSYHKWSIAGSWFEIQASILLCVDEPDVKMAGYCCWGTSTIITGITSYLAVNDLPE